MPNLNVRLETPWHVGVAWERVCVCARVCKYAYVCVCVLWLSLWLRQARDWKVLTSTCCILIVLFDMGFSSTNPPPTPWPTCRSYWLFYLWLENHINKLYDTRRQARASDCREVMRTISMYGHTGAGGLSQGKWPLRVEHTWRCTNFIYIHVLAGFPVQVEPKNASYSIVTAVWMRTPPGKVIACSRIP